jgi:hypothetical protein
VRKQENLVGAALGLLKGRRGVSLTKVETNIAAKRMQRAKR